MLHVVQSWSTRAVSAASPLHPTKPCRGQSLPRLWHLWGICVGEGTSLDLHSLMPMGLKSQCCHAPPPPPVTDTHTHRDTQTRAQRDIHRHRKRHKQTHRYTQRHMDTHTDTHNAVGVPSFPLSLERVYKDSLSCLGPLRTFPGSWRPVVLKPPKGSYGQPGPCLPGGPAQRPALALAPAVLWWELSYSCGLPFPSSKKTA